MEFRPFRLAHLRNMTVHPQHREARSAFLRIENPDVVERPYALSAWKGPKCIAAAGLIELWPHRAVAWAFLSDSVGYDMVAIVRKVRRVIDASPYRRVELTVDAGFEEGQRFAELIGAERETEKPMRAYGSNGGAEIMYAVVKD